MDNVPGLDFEAPALQPALPTQQPMNYVSKGATKGNRLTMTRASPAATRATDVLLFFADHPTQSFTLTDIIRALRLNRATCHAVLASLTEAGFLYRSASKHYVLGPALVAIGRIAREHFSPLDIARLEMRDLADEFDAICGALFRDKNDIVLRDRAGSMSHLGGLPAVGQRMKISVLAGASFMAWSSTKERAAWIAFILEQNAGITRESLTQSLDVMRDRGFGLGVRNVPLDANLWEQDLIARAQVTNYLVNEFDAKTNHHVASIAVPVYDDQDAVAFIIVLSAFRKLLSGNEIYGIARRLIEACNRVTKFNGGVEHIPAWMRASKSTVIHSGGGRDDGLNKNVSTEA